MDTISPVLERHLNNMSLTDLNKALMEQYGEVGYYFDQLSYQRSKLQYIKSVIRRKKTEQENRRRE